MRFAIALLFACVSLLNAQMGVDPGCDSYTADLRPHPEIGCPHTQAGLQTLTAAPGAAIVVTDNRIIRGDLNVTSIFVRTGAMLVFDNANMVIDCNWIKAEAGAKILAGGSDCPIDQKIVIRFNGARPVNPTNDMDNEPCDGGALGSKGMAISWNATIHLFGKLHLPSWSRLSQTAQANATSITLRESVDWSIGDLIVIASTDYSETIASNQMLSNSTLNYQRGTAAPDQSENRTIIAISQDKKTIYLDRPLRFMHYGLGLTSAEVGLLSRHIVFMGVDVDNSSYGGHFLTRRAEIRLSGVEFTQMGQRGILGRYPVHFHIQHDARYLGNYAEHLSIHHNFQRCMVFHESHGYLVRENVAYWTNGHCYFLEESGERYHTFVRNLGIYAMGVGTEHPLSIIPSDKDPSIFWITCPNNSFIDNVAVGAKFGFWILPATQPIGMSAVYYNVTWEPYVRPYLMPLGTFSGNVAHSNHDTGLFFDNFLNLNGTTQTESAYSPRQPPYLVPFPNTNTSIVLTVIEGFIGYKNRKMGGWGRGSGYHLKNCSFIDNPRGSMFNGQTFTEDGYYEGESDNIGNPWLYPTFNLSRTYAPTSQRIESFLSGHETYDNGGPFFVRNTVFKNFVSNGTRKAGALTCLRGGPFQVKTWNLYSKLSFTNANQVYMGPEVGGDNPMGFVMQDLDGTLTSEKKKSTWVIPWPTPDTMLPKYPPNICTPVPEWQAQVCEDFPQGYFQLNLLSLNAGVPNGTEGYGTVAPGNRNFRGAFYRVGQTTLFGGSIGANPSGACSLGRNACFQIRHTLIPRDFVYVRFTVTGGTSLYDAFTPSNLQIFTDAWGPGDWSIIVLPYPASAYPFNVTYGSTPGKEVFSIDALELFSYYWSAAEQRLYFVVHNPASYNFGLNVGSNPNQWGLNSFSASSQTMQVNASCAEGTCFATQASTLPPAHSMPTFFKEDLFRADLKACAGAGSGSAWFMLNPQRMTVDYRISHDQTPNALAATLYNIETGVDLTWPPLPLPRGPMRGQITLSDDLWILIYTGKIGVRIDTTSGSLKGKFGCVGTCVAPWAPVPLQCRSAAANVLTIYNDTRNASLILRDASTNSTWVNYNHTGNPLCGESSILVSLATAYSQFGVQTQNSSGIWIDQLTYQFLEFYVRILDANLTGRFQFRVRIANSSAVYNPAVNVPLAFIDNGIVTTSWTRIRIPLSNLSLAQNQTFRYLLLQPNYPQPMQFQVDEIRFVGGAGSEDPAPTRITAAQHTYSADTTVCTPATLGTEMSDSISVYPLFVLVSLVLFALIL